MLISLDKNVYMLSLATEVDGVSLQQNWKALSITMKRRGLMQYMMRCTKPDNKR